MSKIPDDIRAKASKIAYQATAKKHWLGLGAAIEEALMEERERCAKIVETALPNHYEATHGQKRGQSEVEVFLAAAIRSPIQNEGKT